MLNKSASNTGDRIQGDLEQKLLELQNGQKELEVKFEALTRENCALIESRRFYEQLYMLSPLGYLILDIEGVIQHANFAAARILGCPWEQLLNEKMAAFIDSEEQGALYFFIHGFASIQGGNQARIFKLRQGHKQVDCSSCDCGFSGCDSDTCVFGNRFAYIECRRSAYFDDNNLLKICVSLNDATDSKNAYERIACLNRKLEERLAMQTEQMAAVSSALERTSQELEQSSYQFREREAKLNAIFNAAVEGIITIDRAGTIVSVNAAVETIFGFPQNELVGFSINKIILFSKNKSENYPLKHNLRSLMPNVIGKMRELDGIRKDGSSVPLELSVAEFSIDGEGYYTGLVRDVSLRKLKERQDKEHLDELAHVTRLGLMGEMASGIAHEVNQPLTAIVGYTMASLNFLKAPKPNTERLVETLHKTHNQAVRAGQIIQRMRDFVKPKTIHRSTVDINELIFEATSLCVSDLKNNNIHQRYDLIKNPPMVYVDSVQIEQVLLNLIRNSMEALKRLPQSVRRQLTIQTYLNMEGQLEVRVKDNGPGITDEDRKKIFTPFHTTKSDGMGMGLSISQSIIKSHQGNMYFNSIFGKGTTFYFSLPVQRSADDN